MTPHPAALEAWNRATFDPQTPELELAPAETLQVEQPIAGSHCWVAVPMAFVLGMLLPIVWANVL
ncbi:hypothetical protein [Sphingopyxis macrogoltabida]|uniref:Uncharacterized protein n=1 Tax=Sphingopyxis macrogoltabida TaxID=33050 RepID=A0AAC8Z133_SPHMC|nr:hypothetical protein [Sphingopyxis macrogoltabida]ALJ12596.1 hypothetical protein LH19_06930 [Sphingopyxis macrogoltabida]AMU89933.1 hypothetical protein ATM17_12890 [Sphingopyxis macrogoltabida]